MYEIVYEADIEGSWFEDGATGREYIMAEDAWIAADKCCRGPDDFGNMVRWAVVPVGSSSSTIALALIDTDMNATRKNGRVAG